MEKEKRIHLSSTLKNMIVIILIAVVFFLWVKYGQVEKVLQR